MTAAKSAIGVFERGGHRYDVVLLLVLLPLVLAPLENAGLRPAIAASLAMIFV